MHSYDLSQKHHSLVLSGWLYLMSQWRLFLSLTEALDWRRPFIHELNLMKKGNAIATFSLCCLQVHWFHLRCAWRLRGARGDTRLRDCVPACASAIKQDMHNSIWFSFQNMLFSFPPIIKVSGFSFNDQFVISYFLVLRKIRPSKAQVNPD